MHAACLTRFGTALLAGAALVFAAAPARADIATARRRRPCKKSISSGTSWACSAACGCNSGSCHGSFQGKGGFRLSLFGYDPEKDYFALTRDLDGRRINRADPDTSLLLLKATGQVAARRPGRFGKDSWPTSSSASGSPTARRWHKGSGDIASIAVNPPEYAFTKPGLTGQLLVKATFADGSKEDITPFCDFRTNDDAVVEVNAAGPGQGAAGRRHGRHRLLPRQRPAGARPGADGDAGRLPVPATCPRSTTSTARSSPSCKRLNIVPSDLSSDTEFLRRVTIDTIGSLPTPEEVRDFLADARPDKRAQKIDELLAHPLHAALWATKFCDITGNNTDALENPQQRRPKLSQMWHDWFRKRFAENMPYDEIVHGVLCATSRDGKSPED